ncbi:MAG: Nonribosomal peptide synthetase [Bacteroidetes bacterium]|nr:Nonribosomal peptide synthetase [Bacteroidota bacterium]
MNAYPLSSTQESILLYQEVRDQSCLFNIGGYAILNTNINLPVFFRAFEWILKRHTALRLKLDNSTDTITQYIDNAHVSEIEYLDFSTRAAPGKLCIKWIEDNFQLPMSLYESKLYNSCLLKESDTVFYWYLKMHHIIADGFSMSVLFNDMSAVYSEMLGMKPVKEIKTAGYIDYIRQEQEYKKSNQYLADKEFWLSKLLHIPARLALKESDSNDLLASRKELLIGREDMMQINKYLTDHNISLFNYFAAVVYLFFLNVFASNDLVLGIPVLNRPGKNAKHEVGPYFNVLPFRMNYDRQLSIAELLKKIKADMRMLIKHMRFPILDTIKALDHNGNLYNTTFSYQKFFYQSRINEKKIEIEYLISKEQMNDLDIHILDFNDDWNIKIYFDHKISFISHEIASDLIAKFKNLVLSVFKEDSKKLFEISVSGSNKEESLDQIGSFQF